jgi:hypothetical protein
MRRPSLVALLLVSMSTPALAQDKPYEAVGSASVVGGDVDTARRRALDDAFRQAVDQAVADLAPEAARKASAEVIKKRILRRAKAFTLRHKVLSEKEEGGAYLMHIEAHVSVGALQKELAAIGVGATPSSSGGTPTVTPPTPQARRPKIVLLMVTRDGEGVWATFGSQTGEPGPAAAAVMQELQARGFEVVTAAGQVPPVAGEGGGGDLPVNDSQAAELARAVGAGAALVGGVVVRDGGKVRGTALVGGEAEVGLRLLEGTARVGEARGLGAGYGADRAGAVDGAARSAVAKAMRLVAAKMVERWPAEAPIRAGAGVTVRVRGVGKWQDAADLAKALAQTPGVRSVLPGRFMRQEIALVVLGNVDAAALVRALKSAPLSPSPIVQASGDRTIVVDRPAGQVVPGDDR